MGYKNYLSDYEFDLMTEAQLDVLDFDYQYEQFKAKEEAKTIIADYSWNNRIAMNGMTYGQIQQLNDLEITLSR
jgi:hypothetical protein